MNFGYRAMLKSEPMKIADIPENSESQEEMPQIAPSSGIVKTRKRGRTTKARETKKIQRRRSEYQNSLNAAQQSGSYRFVSYFQPIMAMRQSGQSQLRPSPSEKVSRKEQPTITVTRPLKQTQQNYKSIRQAHVTSSESEDGEVCLNDNPVENADAT